MSQDPTIDTLRETNSELQRTVNLLDQANRYAERFGGTVSGLHMPGLGGSHQGDFVDTGRIGAGQSAPLTFHDNFVSAQNPHPQSATGISGPVGVNWAMQQPDPGLTQPMGGGPAGGSGGLSTVGGGLAGLGRGAMNMLGGITQGWSAMAKMLPSGQDAVERQKTLFLSSQRTIGGLENIEGFANDIRQQMGNRMLEAHDDMAFLSETAGVLNTRFIKNEGAQWAGFAAQSWGMGAADVGKAFAGAQTGQTANALYRMGITMTKPGGGQKQAPELAEQIWNMTNAGGTYKNLEDLNADMSSGAMYMTLNAMNLDPSTRQFVENYMVSKMTAQQKGVELTPEEYSKYSDVTGATDREANPMASLGEAKAGETALGEETRGARMKGWKQANEMLAELDKLALTTYRAGGKATEFAVQMTQLAEQMSDTRYGETVKALLQLSENNKSATPAAIAAMLIGTGIFQQVTREEGKTGETQPGQSGETESKSVWEQIKGFFSNDSSSNASGVTPHQGPDSSMGLSGTSATSTNGVSEGGKGNAVPGMGFAGTTSTPSAPSTGGGNQLSSTTTKKSSSSSNGSDTSGDVSAPGANAGPDKRARYIWDRLIKAGMSPKGAAGILGNLQAESGFDPSAGKGRPTGPVGIAQWLGSRYTDMKGFLKKDELWTIEGQMDYLLHESKTSHKSGWNATKNADSVEAAALAWQDKWEGAPGQHTERRAGFAKDWWKKLGGGGRAKGAWNLGSDEVTKVHRGEMILPAEFASAVREALSGVGGGSHTINLNVSLPNATRNEAVSLVNMVVDELDKLSRIGRAARA